MANTNLSKAKNAKNDEFYTQYHDIATEVEAYLEYNPNVFQGKTVLCPCDDPYESNFFKYFALRFKPLGLKKLIATCYAGSPIANRQLCLFDEESAENKTTKSPHKIEITEIPDMNNDGAVNLIDVELLLASDRNHLTRLKDDGDFRSEEVTKLRDEADIIVTNPPFSLFREFLAWIVEADKQFLIIGNMNAITYKEVFPLIKENKMWLGNRFNKRVNGENMTFLVPDNYPMAGTETYIDKDGKKFIAVAGTGWFTNLDHGKRHQPLPLTSMAENLRYSKHKEIRGKVSYDRYDNYDAIEVPYTDAIPGDYDGVMGVPVSFLDKYSPEQFEIIGATESEGRGFSNGLWKESSAISQALVNGEKVYKRLFIKHRKAAV